MPSTSVAYSFRGQNRNLLAYLPYTTPTVQLGSGGVRQIYGEPRALLLFQTRTMASRCHPKTVEDRANRDPIEDEVSCTAQ